MEETKENGENSREESRKESREESGRKKRLTAAEVHHVVRLEGEEELPRSFAALWWSGLAAGISIGFSMIAMAALKQALPDAGWQNPVIAMGYTAGFLIVILARQQLFTENTITALIPVITKHSRATFYNLLRLWGIVLCANLAGTAIMAYTLSHEAFFDRDMQAIFREIAVHLFANSPLEMFCKGIGAGWLIAALVWVMPSVRQSRFLVIFFFTWLIALGGFTHIIAGSVEALYLVFTGGIGFGDMLMTFSLPTLAGNVIGGSALFTLITYAQVRGEI